MKKEYKPPFLGAAYYPEDWPLSEMDYDIEMMKKSGCNIMRMAEFAWYTMEPKEGEYDFSLFDKAIEKLAEAGIASVMGTPTATPPAWFTSKYPDSFFVKQDGSKIQHGGRRHCCSRNPHYIDYSMKIVEKMAQHYGKNENVIGWQLDNEIYIQAKTGCFCPICKAEFPKYLKNKYGTIENLNDKWCTTLWSQHYDSFEQIPAPQNGWHHPALKDEWIMFQAQGHIDFLKMQAEIIRKYSDAPIGTDMMPFNNLDYEKVAEFTDVMQFNHYNEVETTREFSFWFNYIRGFGKPFWNTETCTCWGDGVANYMNLKPDGWCTINTWMSIMFGAEANLYWLWRTHRAGHELMHGSVLYSTGKPMHIFDEVKYISDTFEKSADFLADTKVVTNGVAMHFSSRMWTMFENQPVVLNFNYFDKVKRYYLRMIENGVTPDIIGAGVDIDKYKVIFSPLMMTLEEHGLNERMKKWVENGGTWVVGPLTDIRDITAGKYVDKYTSVIEDMTGISFDYYVFDRREQMDIRWEDGTPFKGDVYFDMLEGGKPLVTVKNGVNKALVGKSVVAESTYGKGRVIVLGSIPDDASLSKVINMVCTPSYKHSCNVVSVPRKGENHEGVIVGEFDGIPGEITLENEMTDILTGNKYNGRVELKPYELLVLEK